MAHLPHLIEDLALILIAAGVITLLFKRIGQPVVLGYILAGLLISPNVAWVPTIIDLPNIQIWADIGVIFLLFALGLEFSFKKLAKVGGAASLTALVEVFGMTGLGYFTGRMLGWSPIDSFFLGGILAISSTTIIIRAFEEVGAKGRGFVSLVLGILIVEDLVAIVLMVLLTTVAVNAQPDGGAILFVMFKLLFFLVLWFVSGIFFLPTLMNFIRRHTTDETLLIVSLALCFVMVVVTSRAGFSPALGAFIMGSLLAETVEGERIEQLIKSVKNLFAAIFFVSVGMLINPEMLAKYAWPIAIITLIRISGKFIMTVLGALLSGRHLRHSVQAGLSLGPLGEFSFIIAGLGLTLNATSDFLYPIAVGVCAATTFSTPYLIKSADAVYGLLDRCLPARTRDILQRYALSTQRVSVRSDWRDVLRSYGLLILTNSVIITAIFLFTAWMLPPVLEGAIGDKRLINLIGLLVATLLSAPFFWALFMNRTRQKEIIHVWAARENRLAVLGLEAGRVLCGVALFGFLTARFLTVQFAALITIGMVALLLFLFSKNLRAIYAAFERHFVKNLAAEKNPPQPQTEFALWNAHIVRNEVPASLKGAGQTLEELKVRESFGVTIFLIQRGGAFITAPTRHTRLLPGDKVSVLGNDEQIAKWMDFLKPAPEPATPSRGDVHDYVLRQVKIEADMRFCSRTIRECGIREHTEGVVVGLERGGERFLNPDSSFIIEPDDLLWIVGNRQKLRAL